jgi:hypothetical protein
MVLNGDWMELRDAVDEPEVSDLGLGRVTL